MKRLLDEDAAWRLVLAHAYGDLPAGAPSVRVDAEGAWEPSSETTAGARDVLALFLPLAVRKRFVIAQLGQSLDGRIATERGDSHYVTGPQDRRRLHRLRALAQAVVVGAGTAASDDPRLTVREVDGEHPVRVVLDPRGRLDPGLALFTDGAAPTLWVRSGVGSGSPSPAAGEGAEPAGREGAKRGGPPGAERERAGVEIVSLPGSPNEGFEPGELLAMLRERGLDRVLVEGGGVTVSRFLDAGVLDRLHVTVAPLVLGSGRPSLTLPPIQTLDQALRPTTRIFRLGDDVLFDLDLGRARG